MLSTNLFIFIVLSVMSKSAIANTPLVPYRFFKDTIIFENQSPQFVNKIPGLRQKKVGMGLTIAGLGLFATSFALIASGILPSSNFNSNRNTGLRVLIGGVLINPAIGLTVPGAVLWGVGNRKFRRYKENYTPPPPVYYKNVDEQSIPTQERY